MAADVVDRPVTKVETGSAYNCALTTDEEAVCWSTEAFLESPIVLEDVAEISSDEISLGGLVCLTSTGGEVSCFGTISYDYWIDDVGITSYSWSHPTPTRVEALPRTIQSAASADNAAAFLTADGQVYYWGYFDQPNLEVRKILDIPAIQSVDRYAALSLDGELLELNPIVASSVNNNTYRALQTAAGQIKSISVGGGHLCVLNNDGAVWCHGENTNGQLGTGELCESSDSPCSTNIPGIPPTKVQGLPGPVVALSAGERHTCVVTEEGEAWCWGCGYQNQIGDNVFKDHPVPVKVTGLDAPLVSISAGEFHTCGTTVEDSVRCWGLLGPGLGAKGVKGYSATPVSVMRYSE